MKLKALLLAIAVAGFTASFALADDGGHGGHHKRSEHATTTMTTTAAANACAEVELLGTLGTVAPNSFTLTVAKQANEQDEDDNDDDDNNANNAPAVPNMVGQTVTIAVGADTRVSFKAMGALRGPATGDTAKVKALACGTPMTLTAKSVKAQAAGANALKSKSH